MNKPPADDAPSSDASDKKPDIRVSTHCDLGVEIARDLTESGRLARGDGANMSRLSFSSRGRSRYERDPELEALKEPVPPVLERTPASAPVETVAATANDAVSSDAEAGAPSDAPAPGLLSKLARFFGGK